VSIWIDNVETTELWRSFGGGTSEERSVVTIGMDEDDSDRPRWEYENRAIAAIADSLGYVGHITNVHFGEAVDGYLRGTKYIDVTITVEKEW
jgi:hypothetical protein